MKASWRLLLTAVAAFAPLVAGAQESSKPAAPKSILWARTWEGALREASIRNVPIYILVSIGEG
ncbi:MAG TPA: hypothetical protein VK661_03310 [Planctomycetota bacterium]|nr:hypothetical protein [Planctomycetota bacterium]